MSTRSWSCQIFDPCSSRCAAVASAHPPVRAGSGATQSSILRLSGLGWHTHKKNTERKNISVTKTFAPRPRIAV